MASYSRLMAVKSILPSDRYVAADLVDSCRTKSNVRYERIVAVDRMKSWSSDCDLSSDKNEESDYTFSPFLKYFILTNTFFFLCLFG